ncbi:4240_t:CDS:1 [Funneliformis geosporum]|nr:4240_t:CDS:1 [Funneliformis geosporum]
MVDIIVEVKEHLGISDDELDELTVKTYLAMPIKKIGGVDSKLTLGEMISVYNKLGLTNPQEILDEIVPNTGKLGGSDFSNMPNGQNLKSLIDNYNTVSGLTNGRSLNELIDEVNHYQKLSTEFSDIQKQLQSQKDYSEIKTKNATDQQVLDRIKELMGRPTNSDYNNLETEVEDKKRKISELENDNKNNNAITKKDLVDMTNTNLED